LPEIEIEYIIGDISDFLMTPTQIIQTVLLGIIQGLTEFIPVSSSGHLEVFPPLFGWDKPSTVIILFAHLGTLLALVLYFRMQIWGYLKAMFQLAKVRETAKLSKEDVIALREIKYVLLASIPAGLVALLLSDFIESVYDKGVYGPIALPLTLSAMALVGFVFLFQEYFLPTGKKPEVSEMKWWRAVLIGTSQVLALMRGVSRSGITLLVGQQAGLSRMEAARFSFLVSIPLITAASILGVKDLLELPSDQLASQAPIAGLILVSSFVSGLVAIHFLLKYLQKHGLKAFAWYRILFAAAVAAIIYL
jgi:undecaprenyl-diphosphatase